jgi:hypothetical protein
MNALNYRRKSNARPATGFDANSAYNTANMRLALLIIALTLLLPLGVSAED